MGRDAGWLALHGGISGSAHVILIPEIPYEVGSIIRTIKRREANGHPFSIIVISEGAKAKGSNASYLEERKAGEMIRYGGAGDKLRHELEGYSKAHNISLRETRVSVLGYIQRGGSPTNFDRVLGSRFGEHAINELLAKGKFGYIAALRGQEIVSVSFEEACSKQKLVEPENDQMVHTAKSLGVCFGDD